MRKAPEGFALKNPHFDPTKKQMDRTPELIPVKREKVTIVTAQHRGSMLKRKTLLRTTYKSGVVKSGPFPGLPPSMVVSPKEAKVGEFIEDLPLEAAV